MDITSLLHSLPKDNEEQIYLLFEAGAQALASFQSFYSTHAERLYSLYLHPQLTEFKDYGPWLLEVKDHTQLEHFLATVAGCSGVIISPRHLSSVAIQLSRGCTIVAPDGTTSLVRFYANQVIEALASCPDRDWHTFLFSDISQWWVADDAQWRQIVIPPSRTENPVNHIIHADQDLWQKISDQPGVDHVLAEWQKMPTSQIFPPCTQRNMVIKALKKAENTGLTDLDDQMLYALYYLNGEKAALNSPTFQASLARAIQEKIPLSRILAETTR